MSWIQEKYLNLLSGRLRNFKKQRNGLWNFSCPEPTRGLFCGDSKRSPRKARGYAYTKENKLFYRCHNCGTSTTFDRFLDALDNRLYNEYRMEKFNLTAPNKKEPEVKVFKQARDINLVETCLRINESPIARKYLESRKLPPESFDRFFYLEDFSEIRKLFPKYEELPHDSRIIIPIYNRQKTLVGLTGRAINRTPLRYVTLKENENESMIFNIENINFNSKVYVLEGAFDSLFIENAVAVDGSDFEKILQFVPKENAIVIFDNQPRNREIVNKMKKIADEGFSMVIWPENLKSGKDINAMIRDGKTKEEIKEIIDSNTFSGLQCKLMLNDWKRV